MKSTKPDPSTLQNLQNPSNSPSRRLGKEYVAVAEHIARGSSTPRQQVPLSGAKTAPDPALPPHPPSLTPGRRQSQSLPIPPPPPQRPPGTTDSPSRPPQTTSYSPPKLSARRPPQPTDSPQVVNPPPGIKLGRRIPSDARTMKKRDFFDGLNVSSPESNPPSESHRIYVKLPEPKGRLGSGQTAVPHGGSDNENVTATLTRSRRTYISPIKSLGSPSSRQTVVDRDASDIEGGH